MTQLSIEVPDALAGERLDRAVALLGDVTRATADALVSGGEVAIDGQVTTRRSRRLVAGERIEVELPEPVVVTDPAPDPGVDFEVVHADDQVVVIDKPAGLVVHAGAGHADGTLVNGLLARFPDLAGVGERFRPGIVHRLDRDTSGLLVVARTPEALEQLGDALRARTVTRRYRTLVWGLVKEPKGMVDAPLGRSTREPTKMAVVVGGRPARTSYEVVRRFDVPVAATELVCRLHTGRTHQIRVHLQGIGHAVVGDTRYGGARPSLPVDRQFLHAEHLAFTHPGTGERLAFDSSLPADLGAVLDGLGEVDVDPRG